MRPRITGYQRVNRTIDAAVLTLVLMLVALAGCSNSDNADAPEELAPAMSASERERGVQACDAYIERVCACSQARPDNVELKEMCDLAPAKRSSLNMILRLNDTPERPEDRPGSRNTANRIIGSCIAGQSELDSLGCPRLAPR